MNTHTSISTKERDNINSKKIRKVIIDYCKNIKKQHPILNHQNLLGFGILVISVTTMIISSLFYLEGYIPWWVCLILNTFCISVAHEIEHDLFHNLYFKKNRFMYNFMMTLVWLIRPSTPNPWMRRVIHLRHHQTSGTEEDVEEILLGNGRKWGLLRFFMISDLIVAVAALIMEQKSWSERRHLMYFAAKAFIPLAVIYSLILYSFLIFHLINLSFLLIDNPVTWSETVLNTMHFINIAVVIIVGPNMLWSFSLHFIAGNIHYHGDNESGNVVQETQVLNPWWLLPMNAFCFNFGSTHAIHHFIVNEPFYIRQLSAPVAHNIMKEMGVRFNDFGTFKRANRWEDEIAK